MDFSIAIMSLISLIDQNSASKAFSILRICKALRPLRFIARNQGLKIAVFSMLHAMPSVFSIVVISGLFFMIFGIIAVSQFKGAYYFCEDLGSAFTIE